MSQTTEHSYAPLLILLFIPLLLLVSSNDDENSLLTDEQKLEKQKQLLEQQEIRDKELNENVSVIVNSPVIYLPLLLLPTVGYKLYSDRRIRKTGFFMMILLTITYGMYIFGGFGLSEFSLFDNLNTIEGSP